MYNTGSRYIEQDEASQRRTVVIYEMSLILVYHLPSLLLYKVTLRIFLNVKTRSLHARTFYPPLLTYSSSLVTLVNSPFSSFVFQKIGFVSLNPCLTHPSSLTWYKLMKPPE